MAKNGIVIDIGFNGVAGINQMIKDIEKELERVNFDDQIGFSKSFDKQIKDVKNNINGLKTELKNITNGLPSDYSNAFGSLNKSVSELKISFKALETVMTPEQLSKYNNEVINISKDLDNVGNVAKETVGAFKSLENVKFSNVETGALKKELEKIDKYLNKFSNAKPLEDGFEFEEIVEKIKKNGNDLQKSMKELARLNASDAVFMGLNIEEQDIFDKYVEEYNKNINLLKERKLELQKVLQEDVSGSQSKNIEIIKIPIDISTDKNELVTRANKIIEQAQNSVSPFEVELVLVSKYASKNNQKTLNAIKAQLGNIDDEEVKKSVTSMIDDFQKKFKDQILELEIRVKAEEAEKKTRELVKGLQDILKQKLEVNPKINLDGNKAELEELQSDLDNISNNLKLNIKNIELSGKKKLDDLIDEESLKSLQGVLDELFKYINENLNNSFIISPETKNKFQSDISEISESIKDIFKYSENITEQKQRTFIPSDIENSWNNLGRTPKGNISTNKKNIENLEKFISQVKEYQRLSGFSFNDILLSLGATENEINKLNGLALNIDISKGEQKIDELKQEIVELGEKLSSLANINVDIKLSDEVLKSFEKIVNSFKDLDSANKNLENLQKTLKTLNGSKFAERISNLKEPFEELIGVLNSLNLSNTGIEKLDSILSKSKELKALVDTMRIVDSTNQSNSVKSGSSTVLDKDMVSRTINSGIGGTSVTQRYRNGSSVKLSPNGNISYSSTDNIKKDYDNYIKLLDKIYSLREKQDPSEVEQEKLKELYLSLAETYERINQYRKDGIALEREEENIVNRLNANQEDLLNSKKLNPKNEYDNYVSAINSFFKSNSGNSQDLQKWNQKIGSSNDLNSVLNYIGLRGNLDIKNLIDKQFPDVTADRKQQSFVNEYLQLKKLLTNAFDNNPIVSEKDLNNISEIIARLKELQNIAKNDPSIKVIDPAKSTIEKTYNKMKKLYEENTGAPKNLLSGLKNLMEAFEPYRQGKELTNQVKDYFDKETFRYQNAILESGKSGVSMWDKIGERIKLANANFIAMYFSWMDWLRYGREAIQIVTELDTALTELRKVSDASSSELATMFQRASTTAQELGSTVTDVINAQADWSRMGYSLDESDELARVSTIYKNVGDGISQEEANNSLISTLQGFKMTADESLDIIDKFNEVSNNFAISSGGIGDALQRSASSFTAAHTDLSKAIALTTTAKIMLAEYIEIYIKNTFNCWKTLRVLTLQYGGNYHMKV